MKARFYVCCSVVRKDSEGSKIVLSKTGLMTYQKAYSHFCSIRKTLRAESDLYTNIRFLSRDVVIAETSRSVYRFYIASVPVLEIPKSLL